MTPEERIPATMTVNEAIRLYPQTVAVFNAFNIDACCGGAATIEEAARRDGADPDALLAALRAVLEEVAS